MDFSRRSRAGSRALPLRDEHREAIQAAEWLSRVKMPAAEPEPANLFDLLDLQGGRRELVTI